MSNVFNKKYLKQVAVYWPLASTAVTSYGRHAYGAAVEIKCRWEKKSIEYIDARGTRRLSMALVYTDRAIDVGGVLFFGTLSGLTDQTNPKENEGAYEVFRFDNSPDLKKKKYTLKAYL